MPLLRVITLPLPFPHHHHHIASKLLRSLNLHFEPLTFICSNWNPMNLARFLLYQASVNLFLLSKLFMLVTFILLCKKWRQDFGVSALTEEAVKDVAQTGKAFVHDFLDINGRPVLVVVASNHFPEAQDSADDEKLCTFLIEKALSKLPTGKKQILGIIDLRGFGTQNVILNT